jgi:hypothetical protein
VTGPAETESSSARSWVGCALVVLGAAWLVVALLVLDVQTRGSLVRAVGPAVVLVVAGVLVSRSEAA